MKFSVASVLTGALLLALPLLCHTYYLHIYQAMLASVIGTSANYSPPGEPVAFYAISCIGGLILIVLAYLSERKG